MLQIQANREAISFRTAVAYLSQEEYMARFQLHRASEGRWLPGEQPDTAAGKILDSTQKLGFVLA
jgi:hypothetical protein